MRGGKGIRGSRNKSGWQRNTRSVMCNINFDVHGTWRGGEIRGSTHTKVTGNTNSVQNTSKLDTSKQVLALSFFWFYTTLLFLYTIKYNYNQTEPFNACLHLSHFLWYLPFPFSSYSSMYTISSIYVFLWFPTKRHFLIISSCFQQKPKSPSQKFLRASTW